MGWGLLQAAAAGCFPAQLALPADLSLPSPPALCPTHRQQLQVSGEASCCGAVLGRQEDALCGKMWDDQLRQGRKHLRAGGCQQQRRLLGLGAAGC